LANDSTTGGKIAEPGHKIAVANEPVGVCFCHHGSSGCWPPQIKRVILQWWIACGYKSLKTQEEIDE
jgi:hypothetical protein